MRNALSLLTLCHLLCLAPSAAMALGFGRVDSGTVLGQRLNFTTQISVEPQDALTEACVSAEVTAGDSRIPPAQVRISLSGAPNATQKTLRVTTTAVIDEPIVNLNISVGCVARVSRSFTVFADPPVLELARPEPAAPPLVAIAPTPDSTPSAPLSPNISLPREVRSDPGSNFAAAPLRRDPARRSAESTRARVSAPVVRPAARSPESMAARP
ncbi:MAG: hypothetical protein ABIX46_11925, partial [Burkholderiaceae bacterium]